MRRWIATAILVGAVGACGPLCGNGKLNLSNAHIDSSFTCPAGSDQYNYAVKGALDADNQTSSTVTIKSMALDSTVIAINGSWGASVGSKGNTPIAVFSPKTVSSGSKATIQYSSPWYCTDPAGGAGSYADFAIVLTLVTTAGTLKVSTNHHRLKMG